MKNSSATFFLKHSTNFIYIHMMRKEIVAAAMFLLPPVR